MMLRYMTISPLVTITSIHCVGSNSAHTSEDEIIMRIVWYSRVSDKQRTLHAGLTTRDETLSRWKESYSDTTEKPTVLQSKVALTVVWNPYWIIVIDFLPRGTLLQGIYGVSVMKKSGRVWGRRLCKQDCASFLTKWFCKLLQYLSPIIQSLMGG